MSELPAELQRPTPDRLLADLDVPLCEQFLDVPKAQGEPEVQPDRMTDHLRREAVTLVGNRSQLSLRLGRQGLSGEELALD